MLETEFIAEIISGNRITIPRSVRRALNLKEGDLVKVMITKIEGVQA